ncbi:MAG: LLM class F420-dependent oxidoreductase [Actinomycetota bacterium]
MTFSVGVQVHPQHTSMPQLRDAWVAAEQLEINGARVASLWSWDHFFPLYGKPDGPHFEGWTLLSAMAATTSRASVGLLVTCNSYRNPELLADMARTVDHISGGRAVLGIGAGWFERDYTEYGYEYGVAIDRLRQLRADLPKITGRLAKLNPPPIQSPLPLMIGAAGEKVALRIVAEYATMWNGLGTPEEFAHKNQVLDAHCVDIGRDPSEVERVAWFNAAQEEPSIAFDYVDAGATHVIVGVGAPFDLAPVKEVLRLSAGLL